MPRRKKGLNFNFILITLVIVVGAWIAADYYFNVYQYPQKKSGADDSAAEKARQNENPPLAAKKDEPALDAGFKNEIYRDDRFGFEFKYPVPEKDDPQCPKIKKTDDGFSLGIFSFLVSTEGGTLSDFINNELQGMSIDNRSDIVISGQPAAKIDYQTAGMGWYGSGTFVEHNAKIFEFGFLANEPLAKCGGVDDYEDRVYQSVLSTLQFTD